ncbi:MAG: phenylalanine--tRNA ligase subunit beta [Candidatus Kerfeldbacteria bacterium]|nr:phenylalanine--tRNA ligase subunit beta [Candidatus Kerfeldbacteria bacterium]
MMIPISWLREYVKTSASPEAIAAALTNAGIEIEAIVDRRRDFDRVVVGEVVEVKSHPNADKLRLAYVRVKPNGSPQEIVCGAPNIAVGQKVPVALLGAKLPNGLTIEARKIRGIASNGMVCALDELGLGSDHAGIMVLDPTLPVGTPFVVAMGFDEIVLDAAVPSNRSDLYSMRGMAREVAAVLKIAWSDRPVKRPAGIAPSKRVSVKISEPKLCHYYSARIIRGVAVKPSPAWLQRRLRAAGMRPINAVVDATNYIMLAYGQPLHAFDMNQVSGAITVRPARPGEMLTTLDGVKRKLETSMLVIADANGPVALAGVMGGANSEISATTTDIVLESAAFDPVSVRRTAWKLGLQSEASRRFEKGLPAGLADQASLAAAALITELCGGQVERTPSSAGRSVAKTISVTIDPLMFGQVIGKPVKPAAAKAVLTRLGFKVAGPAKHWKVAVPSWRLDVKLPEDLVEEVGRMIGYGDLPDELPTMNVVPHPIPELVELKDRLRDLLVGFGFTETLSHPWYGEPWEREVGGEHIQIANPLNAAQHALRRSLIPQLRSIIEHGVDAGNDVRVFQIGRVFNGVKNVEREQPWKLALGVATKAGSGYVRGRTIKGVVEALSEALGVPFMPVDVTLREVKGRTIEICELDVAALRDKRRRRSFKSLPEFPPAVRDVAVWVATGQTYDDLSKAIVQAGGELLESVELFDVFDRGERRSLAFRLTFRAANQTLTEAQISATMTAITEALRRLGAELR